MARDGTVTSGAYKNSTVTINDRGELVIPAGFKKRRLNKDEVRAWEVVESGKSTLSAHLGQGASRLGSGAIDAAGGLASGVMSFATAPVGTTIGAALSARRPSLPSRRSLGRQQLVVVRVDWVDGKQSWIKLPETHFSKLAAQLSDRLIAAPVPAAPPPDPPVSVAPPPTVVPPQPPPPPSFRYIPGGPPPPTSPPPPPMTQDALASPPAAPTSQPQPSTQPDVIDQIGKLAVLRDQGHLTEDEFAAKKAELLARL